MTKEEFIKAYKEFSDIALSLAEKSRREGLLSMEDNFDEEKANARDVFYYGLRYVIDGTDTSIIERILANIVEQEKDEFLRKFKTIQKEAVIGLQLGFSSRILHGIMNSYTDLAENFDNIEISYKPPQEPEQREIEENTEFENAIMPLEDRAVQRLLREIEGLVLARALKNQSDTVREKFYLNMSERAAEMIKEDIYYLGPVRKPEIDEAQDIILAALKKLIDECEIILDEDEARYEREEGKYDGEV